MNRYIGTSGYSYKEWKARFYPEDLPQKEMLRFYGTQFRSVEINNTFHRMPQPGLLEKWAGEVPADFKFVLKAPQRITHWQRLKGSEDSVAYLLKAARCLHDRLGPLLFQMPPDFKRDTGRLAGFLQTIPPDCHAAFEFRHQSWFEDDVLSLLHSHQAALCIADAENELNIPRVATADWGYLRLRRPDYSAQQLASWAEWILAQSWRGVFVFFKHEDEAKGPQMARSFQQLVDKLSGDTASPERYRAAA